MLNLFIIFSIILSVDWSIKCQEVLKKCHSEFPKAQDYVFKCKDIQFTVKEGERNQKVSTSEKMELKVMSFVFLKK